MVSNLVNFFAVNAGRRHFPQVNNVPSTSVYRQNIRRYIPHGYCDDYINRSRSNSTSRSYAEYNIRVLRQK